MTIDDNNNEVKANIYIVVEVDEVHVINVKPMPTKIP